MKIYILLIASIMILSCTDNKTYKANIPKKTPYDVVNTNVSTDTLYYFLDKALSQDSLSYSNIQPFMIIRSGKLLSAKVKNAVVITTHSDSLFRVELYTSVNGKWRKDDQLDDLEAETLQFDMQFVDYDFDGYNDIYIQCSASNGYSISRGHLITVNPDKMKMESHPEARMLGNMNPDAEKKVVYSYIKDDGCPNIHGLCREVNLWKNGRLLPESKSCTCE